MGANQHELAFTPGKILVIAMRQLGDVLLVTPLLHSLRIAYPLAELDVLLYEGTRAMLEGNPDINRLITTPQRPAVPDVLRLVGDIFRRYDLAISTQTGDRPVLYAFLAAPFRIAPVPPTVEKGAWKRWMLQRWLEFDDEQTHTVIQNLRLLGLIGIQQHTQLIPPAIKDASALKERWPFISDEKPYVVLHPHPMWAYKRWPIAEWQALLSHLIAQEYTVVISGSGSLQELQYISRIIADHSEQVINIAGQLSLAELAYVLGRASLFIGPDTGITHLAAATGVKTVALFGPTNPVKWAPWPYGYQLKINPFQKIGNQQRNNIVLLQGQSESGCVPCHKEGCERHQFSKSLCLEKLSAELVISVLDNLVAA